MLSLDVTKKCLVAEGWCPVFSTKQVRFNEMHHDFIYHDFISKSFMTRAMICRQHFRLSLTCLQFTLQIQDGLQQATYDSNSEIGSIFHVLQTKELPPTYFRTNKFTSAFQEIVDAYG